MTKKNTPVKRESKDLDPTKFSEGEQDLTASYAHRWLERQPPKITLGKDNKIEPDELTLAKMAKALGTVDLQLTCRFLLQAIRTFCGVTETETDRYNVALAILYGLNPQDALESMLAVQMVGVHNLAMEFMKRAVLPEQTNYGVNQNVERATKMLRTFTAQMETLTRYRGKGQQKVTVEHVHVHEGGQAIVGNVQSHTERREGDGHPD